MKLESIPDNNHQLLQQFFKPYFLLVATLRYTIGKSRIVKILL